MRLDASLLHQCSAWEWGFAWLKLKLATGHSILADSANQYAANDLVSIKRGHTPLIAQVDLLAVMLHSDTLALAKSIPVAIR